MKIIDNVVVCPICDCTLRNNQITKHIETHADLSNEQMIKLYAEIVQAKSQKVNSYKDEFIEYGIKYNAFSNLREYLKYRPKLSFNAYVLAIEKFRPINVEKDIPNFFTTFRNYVETSKSIAPSSRKYAKMLVGEDEADEYYETIIKPRNPYTGHGKELSPFSKDFVGYKNKSDDEVKKAIQSIHDKQYENGGLNSTVEYYLKRGAKDIEEAKKMLTERQSTFSYEKCVERYGLTEGTKIFKERQRKWQHTLTSNEESNARQIAGRLKATKVSFERQSNGAHKGGRKMYSAISQRVFDLILKLLPDTIDKEEIRYGTHGGEFKVDIIKDKKFRLLDFYIPSIKLAIEFDGLYWHKDRKESDSNREKEIEDIIPGIKFLRINEDEFMENPDKVINECIQTIVSLKQKD